MTDNLKTELYWVYVLWLSCYFLAWPAYSSSESTASPTTSPEPVIFAHWSNAPPLFYSQLPGRGAIPELVKALLKQAGYSVKFRHVPPGRTRKVLLDGDVDIMLFPTIRNEQSDTYREVVYKKHDLKDAFTLGSEVVLVERRGLLTRQDRSLQISTIAESQRFRVGAVRLPHFTEREWREVNQYKYPVTFIRDETVLLRMLLGQRLDIALSELYLLETANSPIYEPGLKLVYELPPFELSFLFSNKGLGEQLPPVMQRLEAAVRNMKTDSAIHRIMKKHNADQYFQW